MPMKTIEGYSKEKYTNTSVLLAGGGTQALSDFIGSLSWDSTNKKIKYTPVGGSATDLVTLSWDNIVNKPTSLPANGGDADTVDNYHASNLTKFYLSPMSSGAPADSAKSWFIDTMPSASGAIVYNVPGSEKTIIVGKSSGPYGHMLQLNYDDNYLRILRYQSGSWKTTDWEKISAGYADSAGNADTIDGQHLITQVSDWNTDSLSIFKSSENSISNAPTTDYTYGVTLRFHRDFATYHTDLVTSLYHDRLFFRRKTESGYGEWRELIHSGNIGSQSVNYADSAGSIAWGNVTGKPFNWSGQSGQPTWLWGSNDGTNYYVWNPSNFSVNYAKSATSLGSGSLKYMCSLYATSTYNAYKITTNWYKSNNAMPTINIRGYAYGSVRTIDCDIVMYHYDNTSCNYSLTNKGSYPIRVWQAIENDVQVFYINPGEYFGMFNVFVYGGISTDTFSDWSMTTVDAVSGTEIDSKPIATSITGNAGSSNIASTVTVNSSDSDSTYKMLWHSGNTLYSTAGIYCNPYKDYLYAASMQTSDWFRSTGNTGWYNNTYDGGWYMEDSTYIRTYNSKCVYNSNTSQYAFYTAGGITVGSHLWGTSTASTWLDGQKEDRAVINVTNSTDANSFWPLIKWTSSSQGRWDTIGVLGNNLYFMSSLTSRTENDYDTAAYFDMTTSRLYSNGVYHTSYGSSAYALTSDGGVAAIANMSVANAENIWLRESSTNSDCRLAFGTYNSAYTALNSSQYLTYNPYTGRLKLKGSKEHNSVNHGGSISFGDKDYLYMKEATDDVLLQHYKGLVSDTQPIAIGFVGSCPSNSSASLVYKKNQPAAVTVTCTRVSSGRFKVGVSNISGKPIIAHLQVTPVRNYAQYEFAFAYIEDFTMDTADGGMEIASGSTGYFYVRTGRIHCQVTWAVGDYVATGDTGGFTGVVYAMINESLSTMPSTSW